MSFGPYPAIVVGVHDGDTIYVDVVLAKLSRSKKDVDLGFNVHRDLRGIVLERQSVRLFGCNAPELFTPAGRASKAHIDTLVRPGDTVTLVSEGWDKYGGRIDGVVTLADGRDLAKTMIADGFAISWDGHGPKPVLP